MCLKPLKQVERIWLVFPYFYLLCLTSDCLVLKTLVHCVWVFFLSKQIVRDSVSVEKAFVIILVSIFSPDILNIKV